LQQWLYRDDVIAIVMGALTAIAVGLLVLWAGH